MNLVPIEHLFASEAQSLYHPSTLRIASCSVDLASLFFLLILVVEILDHNVRVSICNDKIGKRSDGTDG